MPIDASIPLQAKGVQLESPMNQLAMMSDAMKIGEMQRSTGEQNQLNEYLRSGADLASAEGKRGLLNYGKTGIAHAKAIGDIEKSGLEGRKLKSEVDTSEFKLTRDKTNNAILTIANFDTPQAALQDLNRRVQSGELPLEVGQQHARQIQSMPWAQYKTNTIQSLLTAHERTISENTKRGQDISAESARRGQDLTYGATIRGQNMQYDPTLQENIATAKAAGTEYGKAGAQTNIALPGAIATGEEAIRKVDELVGKAPVVNAEGKVIVAGTKPAAGFGQAVGIGIPGLKYVPGSSAADFNARLNEIQGGAFLQAFTTLKGGGSITEKEGEKATAAINRMSTAQSEKEFNIAAREYQDVLRTGIERAKVKAATLSKGGGGATLAPTGEIDFNSLK